MGIQFTDICLITTDVLRLCAFYERVFKGTAEGDAFHSTLVAGGVNLTFDHVAPLFDIAPLWHRLAPDFCHQYVSAACLVRSVPFHPWDQIT